MYLALSAQRTTVICHNPFHAKSLNKYKPYAPTRRPNSYIIYCFPVKAYYFIPLILSRNEQSAPTREHTATENCEIVPTTEPTPDPTVSNDKATYYYFGTLAAATPEVPYVYMLVETELREAGALLVSLFVALLYLFSQVDAF